LISTMGLSAYALKEYNSKNAPIKSIGLLSESRFLIFILPPYADLCPTSTGTPISSALSRDVAT
jgi:hypothetical protein